MFAHMRLRRVRPAPATMWLLPDRPCPGHYPHAANVVEQVIRRIPGRARIMYETILWFQSTAGYCLDNLSAAACHPETKVVASPSALVQRMLRDDRRLSMSLRHIDLTCHITVSLTGHCCGHRFRTVSLMKSTFCNHASPLNLIAMSLRDR